MWKGKPMKLFIILTCITALLSGCGPGISAGAGAVTGALVGAVSGGTNRDVDRVQKQSELMQHLMKEPDAAGWQTQRDQTVQMFGDRVLNKDFNGAFDSLTGALTSMGMTISNMERQSGYIAAHGELLPQERAKELRSEELNAWCEANGYDPSLLEKRGKYDIDPDVGSGIMARFANTLTISLVKQSEQQTKATLRINGVYYPPTLEESYKTVWAGIDKQMSTGTGTN